MALKELYIKTGGTSSPSGSTDQYVTGGWVDAFETWGLSLEDEGLSRLITPRSHKQPVTNKNVTASGAYVIPSTIGYVDERTVSLPMHIVAPDKETFWARYRSFCSQVLSQGTVYLKSGYFMDGGNTPEPVVFTFIYQDVQNFTEFIREMAKFDVVFYESNG